MPTTVPRSRSPHNVQTGSEPSTALFSPARSSLTSWVPTYYTPLVKPIHGLISTFSPVGRLLGTSRCHGIFGFPTFWHPRTNYPRMFRTPMQNICRIFGTHIWYPYFAPHAVHKYWRVKSIAASSLDTSATSL